LPDNLLDAAAHAGVGHRQERRVGVELLQELHRAAGEQDLDGIHASEQRLAQMDAAAAEELHVRPEFGVIHGQLLPPPVHIFGCRRVDDLPALAVAAKHAILRQDAE
jgi:hypothetical protein